MFRRLFSLSLLFRRNTHGNVGMMLAICALPLSGAVGAAVDFGRLYDARNEVKMAMDAAVLAGTRALMEKSSDKAAAIKVAETFYAANTVSLKNVVNQKITFSLNAKGNGIAAEGNGEMATSFLAALNVRTLPLFPKSGARAVAEAGSPGNDLEISLMLDVTGSMCNDGQGPCTSSTKLTALKDAAAKLIDTVVWKDQSQYTSKIAIVPFSTRVRIEPDGTNGDTMKKLTGLTPTWSGHYQMCTSSSGSGASETGGNWTCKSYQTNYYNNWKIMPCVTDRFFDSSWSFELTDAEPGPGLWLNAHDGSRMTDGPDSSKTKATSALGDKKSDPATHWNYEPSGSCADVANANEILPLTNDTAKLKSKISSLEAYGATAGVLGTAFSWYLLSPDWKNIWTGQSQPQSYSLLTEKNTAGKPKLRKIAVLMTDGAYNTLRGWKDQDLNFLSDSAIAMCKAMKDKGIEIYTVGFALSGLTAKERTTAEATLSACGSGIDHFYQSLDIEQLNAAFRAIGNKVAASSVRLVE